MAILRTETMSDVEALMREYVRRYEAGESADPADLLERVEGLDRTELEALVDAYLARAPRRAFDPERYAGSPASDVVDSLSRSLAGASGLWPAVLPRLREAARLRRQEVVERLAAALGARGSEVKVGAYYHQMEQGLLPAEGVSDRVLEALGEIVGQSTDALRRAGAAIEPGAGGPAEGAAFARTAVPDPAFVDEVPDADAVAGAPAAPAADAGEWDEVDRLFRGG